MPKTKHDLNVKQLLFVKEYLVDKNATKAAERAGYSKKTSYAIGFKLLKNTQIEALVAGGIALQHTEVEKRAKKFGITKERWLREIAAIAFANMDDYASITPKGIRLIASADRRRSLGRAIKKLSESSSMSGGSQAIELHPKLPALELIGKHFNWITADDSDNEKDKGEKKTPAEYLAYLAEKTKSTK